MLAKGDLRQRTCSAHAFSGAYTMNPSKRNRRTDRDQRGASLRIAKGQHPGTIENHRGPIE